MFRDIKYKNIKIIKKQGYKKVRSIIHSRLDLDSHYYLNLIRFQSDDITISFLMGR